jgi:molybdate transport system substrate-binding protein
MSEPAVKIVGLFPETSHPKIIYPGAAVAASTNRGAAPFLVWLHSAKGEAVFKKYGFVALK